MLNNAAVLKNSSEIARGEILVPDQAGTIPLLTKKKHGEGEREGSP